MLMALLAQVSATMLGFLLAALAILASIAGSRLVQNMKKTGHYSVLLKRFAINSLAFGIAMVSSIFVCLLNTRLTGGAIISSSIFVFSCFLLLDVGRRLWLVLEEVGR